jgi:hypothetical protein
MMIDDYHKYMECWEGQLKLNKDLANGCKFKLDQLSYKSSEYKSIENMYNSYLREINYFEVKLAFLKKMLIEDVYK